MFVPVASGLVLLVATVAVLVAREDDGATQVAVGAGSTSSTSTTDTSVAPETTAPANETTTTSGATSPSTARRRTTTTTARSATTTTTSGTTTTVVLPKNYGKTPLEPGTEEWGSGGLGASRTVEQAPTTVKWGIYPRDLYGPENLQTTVEIHEEGVVTNVHVSFGDGTTWETSGYYSCDPQQSPSRPYPIYFQSPHHDYGPPGDYPVTVRVTVASCDDYDPTSPPEKRTVTAAITVHVHAETCRPGITRDGCPG